uniref:TM2 domain-containing protein n=1 Tax=Rhabditophanes sp. KR3021 TaxID=114890 RepID=A0AC35TV01_9BILA
MLIRCLLSMVLIVVIKAIDDDAIEGPFNNITSTNNHTLKQDIPPCDKLRMGQFMCDEPVIDIYTGYPDTCKEDNSVILNCTIIPGLHCLHNATIISDTFLKTINNACMTSKKYNYHLTLALSIIFGVFGLDRFYLGYYALGFLKLSSYGLYGSLYILDVILISLQLLGPADGSGYATNYYWPNASNNLSSVPDIINCFGCMFFDSYSEHDDL